MWKKWNGILEVENESVAKNYQNKNKIVWSLFVCCIKYEYFHFRKLMVNYVKSLAANIAKNKYIHTEVGCP